MKFKYYIFWFFTLIVIPLHSFASNVILITGFEPFGGSNVNGSWEAVKNLHGKRVGDKEIVVAMLPVLWDVAATTLQNLVRAYQPAMIISFGEAAGSPVRFETLAHNIRDNYPDNHNKLPKTN